MITSRDNSLLRQIRAVRDGKISDSIFVEGLRLAEEAVESGLHIQAAVFSEELSRKPKATSVISRLQQVADRVAPVSEKLLESISFTKTPQGVVLVTDKPQHTSDVLGDNLGTTPLVVVLHEINNPVNVGAILRTAEAAGVGGVVTTLNTSDPFSPKALRGAMGSAFRLPIWAGASYAEAIAWCHSRGIGPICADGEANVSYIEVDWTAPIALLVGRESNGFSTDELRLAGMAIKVPMRTPVESLNVSVAAGIILYEAARQRGFPTM
ncbi:MAG: TrmH family RNA methyltransferase [Pyrinomonadaceae bacterium]